MVRNFEGIQGDESRGEEMLAVFVARERSDEQTGKDRAAFRVDRNPAGFSRSV